MGNLAFIVSGIEQSEESRIYQFRAATPAEVQAADQQELEVPGRFRFEQVINTEWDLGSADFYISQGIAIDPYGCVTIPTGTIATLVDSATHGALYILISKPGNDDPFIAPIQLADYNPDDDDDAKRNDQKASDPVPATKVGDMVIFEGV